LVLTPIAGCIAGASAGSAHGTLAAVLCGCAGLLIGAVIFAANFLLGAVTFEVAAGNEANQKPRPIEWFAGLFFLLCVGAAPIAACLVAAQCVLRILLRAV
jgi:hypothetical protein